MMRSRLAGIVSAAALALAAFGAPALAEEGYPTRPVTMIVPFAPGGASDVVARLIQVKMSQSLGQNVVIENRTGADGNIGMTSAAAAAPDGYTIYLGNIGTVTINPHIYKDLTVDPLTDFEPVTMVVGVPGVLVVYPELPVKTVAEFIDYAKSKPGELSFASSGSAALNRLQMEQFRLAAGLDMVHVPYRGGAGPATAAVIGGHVPTSYISLSSAIGHMRENRLRALAISTKERLSILPDLPTMTEAGFPANVSASWQGIFVPKGTPASVIAKLAEAVKAATADPEVAQRLLDAGAIVETSTDPEEFRAFTQAESLKWKDVIQQVGAIAD